MNKTNKSERVTIQHKKIKPTPSHNKSNQIIKYIDHRKKCQYGKIGELW